jgi:ATP-binding cassette, subfamily C, bacterial LapB
MFDYLNCVKPLLDALGWKGNSRRIFEVVPHLQEMLELNDLRNMMVNLGYVSRKIKTRLGQITPSNLPCLFVSLDEKNIYVIHKILEDALVITDCRDGTRQKIPLPWQDHGHIYTFHELVESPPLQGQLWIFRIVQRFRPFLFRLIIWSFSITLLGLILPIFMRGIYDFVIPSFSQVTLFYLGLGLGLSFLILHFLEDLKARIIAYIGARLDVIISTEIMNHLLFLPMPMMEGATIASQVTRLRQFDVTREVFTGPFAHLIIEIPFIIVFIIALALFGGPVAFVPLIVILIYVVLGFLFFPNLRQATRENSVAIQTRRSFFIESVSHLPYLKQLGVEPLWLKRYRDVGASTSLAGRQSEHMASVMVNISQILLKTSGAVTILWATLRAMEGLMTPGSLIAVVILVWRALMPIHTVFLIVSRLDQIRDSINQINRLMLIPTEKHSLRPKPLKLTGHVNFKTVTFRYPSDATPALQGINFEIPPGEMLAIIGENGSGKTTVTKLLLNLYPAQVGQIIIDGTDVRQYDPIQLRQSISYAPNLVQFFHGSIAQNMRLVNPEASETEIQFCLEQVGLLEEVNNLPQGVHTRIDDQFMLKYSSGFLQKLNLARAFVRKSKLIIFDEPTNNLDLESDQNFINTLMSLKGKATIICVTHRPSIVRLADRVLMLQNGFTRAYGPSDKVLAALSGGQI